MTPRERVWKVCDRLGSKGKDDVSVQAVIDDMTGKPPFRAMARGAVMLHVRDWKAANAYKPRLDLKLLPEAMQAGLIEFAEKVWASAMVEATARLANRHRLAEAERVATDELLREAGAKLDKDQATGLERDKEVLRLTGENAALRAEVGRVHRRLDHIRAEEFWDRVMREVFALIPTRGVMTVEEILPRLRQSTRRGARLHREPLDVETLRKKMDVRVHHGKFFVRNYDLTYQREARGLAAIGHGET